MLLHERYIVDANGKRVGVILDLDEYERLLEQIEELECTRAYDAAMASGEESIPLGEAGLQEGAP